METEDETRCDTFSVTDYFRKRIAQSMYMCKASIPRWNRLKLGRVPATRPATQLSQTHWGKSEAALAGHDSSGLFPVYDSTLIGQFQRSQQETTFKSSYYGKYETKSLHYL